MTTCPRCFLTLDVHGFCPGCGGTWGNHEIESSLRIAVADALKLRSVMDVLHDVADMVTVHRGPTERGPWIRSYYEQAANEIRECADNIAKGVSV